MTTESVEAWLIHKKWVGESSAIIYFYTRQYGILTCRYRGCRSSKKQASLLAFTPLHLTFNVKNSWYYVQSLELLQAPLDLNGSNLFSALYVNELLFYSNRDLEANPALYNLYTKTLKALPAAVEISDIEQILRRFEWDLLKESGYEIPVDFDMTGQQLISSERYVLQPGDGLKPSFSGAEGYHLNLLAQGASLDAKGLKAVKPLMRVAINHLLDGKPIKARALFKVLKKTHHEQQDT